MKGSKLKKPSFSSSLVADCNEFRCKFVLIIQLFILSFFLFFLFLLGLSNYLLSIEHNPQNLEVGTSTC